MSEITANSPEETHTLGERLGAVLERGDVVLLSGELGAGKTAFVKGVAQGLGYDGAVSSKSFVLLGEYQGRLRLYHADLYRLEDPEQVADLALDEISAEGVLIVEWPERAWEVLPPEHLLIRFEVTGAETRVLQPEARGDRAQELAAALAGGSP
jgi:tRNA threonylcarbamoyladenosine biosynthesis protein TsaE